MLNDFEPQFDRILILIRNQKYIILAFRSIAIMNLTCNEQVVDISYATITVKSILDYFQLRMYQLYTYTYINYELV